MAVPPPRPMERTSSDDRTRDNSVRRVRLATLPRPRGVSDPVRFYIHRTFQKPAVNQVGLMLGSVEIAESQEAGQMEGRMMWDLVRRVEGGETGRMPERRPGDSIGFAAKVIGVGVFAGLML